MGVSVRHQSRIDMVEDRSYGIQRNACLDEVRRCRMAQRMECKVLKIRILHRSLPGLPVRVPRDRGSMGKYVCLGLSRQLLTPFSHEDKRFSYQGNSMA